MKSNDDLGIMFNLVESITDRERKELRSMTRTPIFCVNFKRQPSMIEEKIGVLERDRVAASTTPDFILKL